MVRRADGVGVIDRAKEGNMPFPEQDFSEQLADALEAVLDGLRGAVTRFGQALSPERLVTLLEPVVTDLLATIIELGSARPAPDQKFLAQRGTAPGPGQMTWEDFSREVARLIEEGWTDELVTIFGPITSEPSPQVAPGSPPPPPTGLAANVLAVISAFAPLADPEVWIRVGTQIRGLVSGQDAARQVADHVLEAARDAAMAWAADWPDDVPTTDEEKKAIEPDVALPDWIGDWIDAVIAQIPGATAPSDARVGRDVHRAVLSHYATTHPDRLAVFDGRVRIIKDTVDVRVSQISSAPGSGLDPADVLKLQRFRQVMRDPQSQRAIRPDIADLESPPVRPRDDWGWFELKPMADLREAIEEVYAYYLRTWNDGTADRPDWHGDPGVWQPTIVFVTPKYGYLFAAVTVVPGAIGYLTYNFGLEAEVAAIAAAAALADMLIRRLLVSIRRALEDAGRGLGYLFEFVTAWADVLIGLLLVALAGAALLPEITAAEVLTATGLAAERIARLIASTT